MSRYWTKYMYYVASTTSEGDPDVVERKWRMLALHVQNIHDKRTHRELEGEARNRLWLIAGNLSTSSVVTALRPMNPFHERLP